MAAAEARAVWQRAVNRCFVQEDAKRAPKLACCQPSSSASAKQVDSGSGSAGVPDPRDQSSACFMPLNRNHRFPDLSSDTRWWAQMKPGYGNQNELMSPSEADIDIPGEGSASLPAKDDSYFLPEIDQDSVSCKKRNLETGETEGKTFTCEDFQEYIESMETRESYGFVNIGYESSEKFNELSFDLDSPWNLSSEKAEPWWRTTDTDELASFVAQKSLDYVENCDLPPPQKMHKGRHSYSSPRYFGIDGLSSVDRSQAGYITNPTVQGHGQQRAGFEQSSSEISFSHKTSSLKDRAEKPWQDSSESGLSKAELLQALRHSQTRAREAEKAAKEACEDKDHLVKILFKQAYQLFAYKQWFQLLQLEALYLQIKKKKKKGNNTDPSMENLPWMHNEAGKQRRQWEKDNRDRGSKQNSDVTKYAVAFALGLLLGWTVGWMLPF
ncbi:PREDICTED: uncharacterized protein LOC104817374 [Tarenaya hassleriana]|uniref:uncharacterized protein LOC104817374 n=1 Tax=Tarenaya hassleriana TaxID=28532 RepID=UPI00053C7C59|nr:PREDICTED: uncharacterized protein LOC104817374 [Tarenaya hassleriana]XP_010544850.1 PREDICTED: uncharacterized protein LOC104817374 [Tarenaya hassleriana]